MVKTKTTTIITVFNFIAIPIVRKKVKVKSSLAKSIINSPSGESTTTECGVNYEQLAVITEVAQCGTPSCSQPQLATDNGVRDGRSN